MNNQNMFQTTETQIPEQFHNELDYLCSVKLLEKMLAAGLITQAEYTKIDKLNRISFAPKLAPIMR